MTAGLQDQCTPPVVRRCSEAIMRKLRQSMKGLDGASGWAPDDSTHHCHWSRVKCNSRGQVIVL